MDSASLADQMKFSMELSAFVSKDSSETTSGNASQLLFLSAKKTRSTAQLKKPVFVSRDINSSWDHAGSFLAVPSTPIGMA